VKGLPDVAVGFVLGLALMLLIFLFSSDFAAHYEICEPANTGAKDCASYSVLSYALHKVGATLDALNGVITAIATAFIAWFTLSLRQSTDKLWDAGERQLKLLGESSAAQSRDMQASIEAAQKSADAAMLAVGAERAWMMHEGLPIIVIKDTSTKSKIIGLQATPIWKNMGRSPALGTNIAVSAAVIPIQLRFPPEFHRNWQSSRAKPPLGPNQLMSGAPDIMEEPQASAILQGKAAWIVYSAIRYQDMFNPGIERFSEVCLRVTRNGDINTPDGVAPNWQTMAFGPQNTVS
jgi:hypothetical protein